MFCVFPGDPKGSLLEGVSMRLTVGYKKKKKYLGLGVFIQGHYEISPSCSTSKDKKRGPTLDELFHT